MTHLLLQAGAEGAMSFLPLIMIVLVMYLFFFRPQMKRQKEEGNSAVRLQKAIVLY